MHRPALALLLAALATSATAKAQTYDAFNGGSIDTTRWVQTGDLSKATQANGSLQLFGRGFRHEFGVVALRGLSGGVQNLTLDLHYHGFLSGQAGSGFRFFMYQPYLQGSVREDREISIGMGTWWDWSANREVTGFQAEFEIGNTNPPTTLLPSTQTAGVLRIQRSGTTVELFYGSSTSSLTRLFSYPNFFASTDITFGIDIDTDQQSEGVDVFCDRVDYVGTLSPAGAVQTIGSRCLSLGALATQPRRGQPLQVVAIGDAAFRGNSALLGIGLSGSQINLPWPGAPGCTLYVNPLLVLANQMDGYGEWSVAFNLPMTIPINTVLLFQFAAATNRNVGGQALSNGLRLTVY